MKVGSRGPGIMVAECRDGTEGGGRERLRGWVGVVRVSFVLFFLAVGFWGGELGGGELFMWILRNEDGFFLGGSFSQQKNDYKSIN